MLIKRMKKSLCPFTELNDPVFIKKLSPLHP